MDDQQEAALRHNWVAARAVTDLRVFVPIPAVTYFDGSGPRELDVARINALVARYDAAELALLANESARLRAHCTRILDAISTECETLLHPWRTQYPTPRTVKVNVALDSSPIAAAVEQHLSTGAR